MCTQITAALLGNTNSGGTLKTTISLFTFSAIDFRAGSIFFDLTFRTLPTERYEEFRMRLNENTAFDIPLTLLSFKILICCNPLEISVDIEM